MGSHEGQVYFTAQEEKEAEGAPRMEEKMPPECFKGV